MEKVLVYITASDEEEAELIARRLVEKRLVACANVVKKVKSFYYWEGKLQETGEALVLCKSFAEKSREIMEEVKRIHSYKVPCINFIPIAEGLEAYWEWAEGEVGK